MEQNTIVVWHQQKPLIVYESLAAKFGLSGGSQIQDNTLYKQLVEENTEITRSITGLKPAEDGEICGSCTS